MSLLPTATAASTAANTNSNINTNTSQPGRITTSIPYVNAQPHIGHALEFVQADVLARYHRLCGRAVHFQTGTDENASKNVQAAQDAGVPTAELVNENADRFQALADRLQVSYDAFIRTSSDNRHKAAVEQFWSAAQANGDIYKRTYDGLYCVGCELFYRAAELDDGLCPIHRTKPEAVSEKNYFFRLSRYQDKLAQLITSDHLRIVPETRKNEVLSFIRQGLQDFSISRDVSRTGGWGLPVPDDSSQIIYVWFDALINYISGLGYSGQGYGRDGAAFQTFWTETTDITHVIGKDISRFHAIYWPAMLLSVGLPLPTKILVHGFITANGQKIAKSSGNVVDPTLLLEGFGTDALRYYLIRHVPTTGDANFTNDIFAQSYKGELADQLGNLVQRAIRMLELYADGVIPQPSTLTADEENLRRISIALPLRIADAVAQDALHQAMGAVWALISATNKYVVETRPWELAKKRGTPDGAARLDTCLYALAESLRLISVGLQPFLPETAAQISLRLGSQGEDERPWPKQLIWGGTVAGTLVQNGPPLFPKK